MLYIEPIVYIKRLAVPDSRELAPPSAVARTSVEMPRQIEAERETVPLAGGSGMWCLCRMHGANGGAPKGNSNASSTGFTRPRLSRRGEWSPC